MLGILWLLPRPSPWWHRMSGSELKEHPGNPWVRSHFSGDLGAPGLLNAGGKGLALTCACRLGLQDDHAKPRWQRPLSGFLGSPPGLADGSSCLLELHLLSL